VLRWTISNGVCLTSIANVTITINQPPTTAMVGPSQISSCWERQQVWVAIRLRSEPGCGRL
jgi:hypothetical protein